MGITVLRLGWLTERARDREVWTRVGVGAVWVLVTVGAVTGPVAWSRASTALDAIPTTADDLVVASGAGLGAIGAVVDDAVLTAVVPLADGYWSVQATGPGGQRWAVGVSVVDGAAHPIGGVNRLPALEQRGRVPLVEEMYDVAAGGSDPVLATVRAWAEGWLRGEDVSRFAAAALTVGPVGRPYESAEVIRMGGSWASSGLAVAARVTVATTGPAEELELNLVVADRGDGTWEVVELLPAPLLS